MDTLTDYIYKTRTRAGKPLEITLRGIPVRVSQDQNGKRLELMSHTTTRRVEEIQASLDRYLSRHDETERRYFVDFRTGEVTKPVTRVRPASPALERSA